MVQFCATALRTFFPHTAIIFLQSTMVMLTGEAMLILLFCACLSDPEGLATSSAFLSSLRGPCKCNLIAADQEQEQRGRPDSASPGANGTEIHTLRSSEVTARSRGVVRQGVWRFFPDESSPPTRAPESIELYEEQGSRVN